MFRHQTKIWEWIGAGIVAGVDHLITAPLLTGGELSNPVRAFAAFAWVFAPVLGIAAVVLFVDWLLEMAIARLKDYRIAMTITPRSRIIELYSRMTAEQIAAAQNEVQVIEVIAGSPGPVYMLRLPDGAYVPRTFAEEFFRDDGVYLRPERGYPDDVTRQYAKALTETVCAWGFAQPSRGPYPARWLYKEAALAHWDLDISEPQEAEQ